MEEVEKKLSVPRAMDNIHYVCQVVTDGFEFEKLLLKKESLYKLKMELQIILYELFSNSIKHSQGENIVFLYKRNEKEIFITVETTGKGYYIKPVKHKDLNKDIPDATLFPPYPKELIGKEIIIYMDSEYLVFSKIVDSYSLDFGIRHKKYEKELLNDLNEHYGVFLLNKLCDEVKYRFENNNEKIIIRKGIIN